MSAVGNHPIVNPSRWLQAGLDGTSLSATIALYVLGALGVVASVEISLGLGTPIGVGLVVVALVFSTIVLRAAVSYANHVRVAGERVIARLHAEVAHSRDQISGTIEDTFHDVLTLNYSDLEYARKAFEAALSSLRNEHEQLIAQEREKCLRYTREKVAKVEIQIELVHASMTNALNDLAAEAEMLRRRLGDAPKAEARVARIEHKRSFFGKKRLFKKSEEEDAPPPPAIPEK